MTNRSKFLWIGVLWLVMIGGFILTKQFTLLTGTEVLLKTVPVDQRDLFRGDYVILRYAISTIQLNSVQTDTPGGAPGFGRGQKVFVALKTENGYGIVSGVFSQNPPGGLYLKGIIRDVRPDQIWVEYGIESYFVPEGKGKDIETRREGLSVKAAIDRSGNAIIKSLWRDGKEIK